MFVKIYVWASFLLSLFLLILGITASSTAVSENDSESAVFLIAFSGLTSLSTFFFGCIYYFMSRRKKKVRILYGSIIVITIVTFIMSIGYITDTHIFVKKWFIQKSDHKEIQEVLPPDHYFYNNSNRFDRIAHGLLKEQIESIYELDALNNKSHIFINPTLIDKKALEIKISFSEFTIFGEGERISFCSITYESKKIYPELKSELIKEYGAPNIQKDLADYIWSYDGLALLYLYDEHQQVIILVNSRDFGLDKT